MNVCRVRWNDRGCGIMGYMGSRHSSRAWRPKRKSVTVGRTPFFVSVRLFLSRLTTSVSLDPDHWTHEECRRWLRKVRVQSENEQMPFSFWHSRLERTLSWYRIDDWRVAPAGQGQYEDRPSWDGWSLNVRGGLSCMIISSSFSLFDFDGCTRYTSAIIFLLSTFHPDDGLTGWDSFVSSWRFFSLIFAEIIPIWPFHPHLQTTSLKFWHWIKYFFCLGSFLPCCICSFGTRTNVSLNTLFGKSLDSPYRTEPLTVKSIEIFKGPLPFDSAAPDPARVAEAGL